MAPDRCVEAALAGKKHSRSYVSQPRGRIRRGWTSKPPRKQNGPHGKGGRSALSPSPAKAYDMHNAGLMKNPG